MAGGGPAVPPGFPPLPNGGAPQAPAAARPPPPPPKKSNTLELPPMDDESTFSFAAIRGKLEDSGLEAPSAINDSTTLAALLQEVSRQQAAPVSPGVLALADRSAVPLADRSVAELKSRLKDLGLKPLVGVDKSVLVSMIEEAEKQAPQNPGYWDEAFEDGDKTGSTFTFKGDRFKGGDDATFTFHGEAPSSTDGAEIFTFSGEAPSSLANSFSCVRGHHGVAALSLSMKSCPPTPLDVTMSAADAIKGTKFKWVRGEAIGRGSLGMVYKALDQLTGRAMAVKQVVLNTEEEADVKLKLALENEINLLQDLKHPHIVSYLGHDYIDSCLYMYLEYMEGGSMSQVLQTFGAFEESLIADYTRQMLEGLVYLHSRDPPVVHRDIKGANTLVGLDGRVKLADFGCSKRSQETMSYTLRGSVPWMAPEVIAHTRYGRSADVWSFGCVLIEMGSAKVPWGKFDNQLAAMVKIGMSKDIPPLPPNISSVCQAFIQQCLQRDQSLRPSASDLLSDPFIRDVLLPE